MSVSGELVGGRAGRGGDILRSRDRAALARIGVVAAAILAVLVCLVALTVGAAGLSLAATFDAMVTAATGRRETLDLSLATIVLDIRLPVSLPACWLARRSLCPAR